MRLAIRTFAVLLLFTCFSLSHAFAELPYEDYTKICVSECTAKSAGKNEGYCAESCKCNLDGIKAAGDAAAQTALLANVQELDRIAMTCSGKLGLDLFAKTCKGDCKGTACDKCDCLLNEMKELGAEAKIGGFFAALGRGDAAVKSQMTAMQTKCMK